MLKTELRNPKTTHIDQMRSIEIAKRMSEENAVAVNAVDAQCEQVAKAIDAVAKAFAKNGRLIYMGAGTSGRLGMIDAAECPPTFGVPEEKVIGIIAGGPDRFAKAGEKDEDNAEAGINDLKKLELTKYDIIAGISASGQTAYVIHGLKYAKSLGCITIGITSNAESLLNQVADIPICPDTGAEVITGSTRLKAGTAQKLILNMISTGAMIKSGYVYENLMIHIKPNNKKLRNRAIGIVMELSGKNAAEAEKSLFLNNWDIRSAVEQLKAMD